MTKLEIDQRKVSGLYIHFGKLINDLGSGNPLDALDHFYHEIEIVHQAILSASYKHPKRFNIAKKGFVKALKVLVSNVKNLTPKKIEETYSKMMKNEKLWKKVEQEFGVPDYFK